MDPVEASFVARDLHALAASLSRSLRAPEPLCLKLYAGSRVLADLNACDKHGC